MAITPVQSTLVTSYTQPAVTLARYAQRIDYPECAFFGVAYDGDNVGQCRNIWTMWQRNNIAFYLLEAQQEIEEVVGYPLSVTWVVGDIADEPDNRANLVDTQAIASTLITRWGYVIAGGVRARDEISSGVVVNHATDPAVVTVVGVTDFDVNELLVFHPDSDYPIVPSSVSITGGTLTIEIPRCRMVKPSLQDNSKSGLDYNDLANFADEVDLVHEYNDPSTNAKLVKSHQCSLACSLSGCVDSTDDGCINVQDFRVGHIQIQAATYVIETGWTGHTSCSGYKRVKLNYQAGLPSLPPQAEDAIIRLAHSKMPQEPCGCDITKQMWERDRKVPDVLTRERANCPFGMSDGAWVAWRFAQAMRLVRANVI